MNLKLWGWPIVLGLLTAVGLVAGLVSEGLGDVLAWLGLGLPVWIAIKHGVLRR